MDTPRNNVLPVVRAFLILSKLTPTINHYRTVRKAMVLLFDNAEYNGVSIAKRVISNGARTLRKWGLCMSSVPNSRNSFWTQLKAKASAIGEHGHKRTFHLTLALVTNHLWVGVTVARPVPVTFHSKQFIYIPSFLFKSSNLLLSPQSMLSISVESMPPGSQSLRPQINAHILFCSLQFCLSLVDVFKKSKAFSSSPLSPSPAFRGRLNTSVKQHFPYIFLGSQRQFEEMINKDIYYFFRANFVLEYFPHKILRTFLFPVKEMSDIKFNFCYLYLASPYHNAHLAPLPF